MKECIIIGSGIGGLMLGVILAKNGYRITVLEKEAQVGGSLQCFVRNGVKFETGMHFIGSLDKNQILNNVFKYLEIYDKVSYDRLDTLGYDVVDIFGHRFKFANGKDAFVETLAIEFPKEKDNLVKYYNLVESVSQASSLYSAQRGDGFAIVPEFQLRSVDDVIEAIIRDVALREVLVGNLPLYAGEKGKTPFSIHAFITDFYNKSAFRIVDGSDSLATALVSVINKYGGKVIVNSKVTKIVCDDYKATSVIVNDSECYNADVVVSDIHPIRTFEILDSKLIRPAFKSRISAIPQTVSCFSVYLHFKENKVPYMNNNFYAYNTETVWNMENYTQESWPNGYLYMHLCHKSAPVFAKSGVVISYMRYDELEEWSNTTVGRRGKSYIDFKRFKAEKLIKDLISRFPVLNGNIEHYYTSTPLTYRDYLGYENGGMYGIVKDVNFSSEYKVSHKTKVPNLYLTGQNVNSHGVMGVFVGSMIASLELVQDVNIYEQLIKAGNE